MVTEKLSRLFICHCMVSNWTPVTMDVISL